MQKLIKQVEETTEAARTAREEALPAVVAACRGIEKILETALDGEPLRGLKNLSPDNFKPTYAARIRSLPDKPVPRPWDSGGDHRFLVLNPKGQLVNLAWERAAADTEVRLVPEPAADDDFTVDDLEGLTRALDVVLPRHVKSGRRTGKRYRKAQHVALLIRKTLDEEGLDE
jgi:hypothetical protein